MKGKKLLAVTLGLSLALSGTLIGCGSKDSQKNEQASGKMDKDQYLNLNLGIEPKSLDAAKSNDSYSSYILTEIYEGLTRCEQDKNGQDVIVPAGAKSWEHNKDASVWTFHLRDYNWSDGKPVKAEDFVYAMRRTLNPKTGSTYAFLLSPIKGANEYNAGKGSVDNVGIKAIDDKTLQFTLKQPCPYFLNLTYFKLFEPQRKDVIEAAGERYGSDANTLKVFCGPFKLTKWNHQNLIVLEKNDKYWDKSKVKLSKVNYKIIKDQTAAYNSLYNGELDSGSVSKPEWIKKFTQTGKFVNIKTYTPSENYTFFNQKDKSKVFSNAKVRKAFTIGIKRKEMSDVLFNGLFYPAYSWCPPTIQLDGKDFDKQANYKPVKDLQKENPDPKKLLSEGLKELGMNPDPSKLTVTYLESGTDQINRKDAEYTQQMYKKTLGINMKVEYVEWPIFQRRLDQGNYQLAGMAWTGDYNDPNTFFDMWMTGTNAINVGWSNKKYDDLVKKAMSSLDTKERLKDYKEAEKILIYDDAVIAPTEFRAKNTFRRKYVKNLMTPLFGTTELKYAYTSGRDTK